MDTGVFKLLRTAAILSGTLTCAALAIGCGSDKLPGRNDKAVASVKKTNANKKSRQKAIGGPKRGGRSPQQLAMSKIFKISGDPGTYLAALDPKARHVTGAPSFCDDLGDGTFMEFDPEDTAFNSMIMRIFDSGYTDDADGNCVPKSTANILAKGKIVKLGSTPTSGSEPATGSCWSGVSLPSTNTTSYRADTAGISGTAVSTSQSLQFGTGFSTIAGDTTSLTPTTKTRDDSFTMIIATRGTDEEYDDLDASYGATIYTDGTTTTREDYCEYWDGSVGLNSVAGKYSGVEYADNGTTVTASDYFEYTNTKNTFTESGSNYVWETAFTMTGYTCYGTSKSCSSASTDKDTWEVTQSWKYDSNQAIPLTVTTVLNVTYSDGTKMAKINFNADGSGKSDSTDSSSGFMVDGQKVADISFTPNGAGTTTVLTYPDGTVDTFTD